VFSFFFVEMSSVRIPRPLEGRYTEKTHPLKPPAPRPVLTFDKKGDVASPSPWPFFRVPGSDEPRRGPVSQSCLFPPEQNFLFPYFSFP